MSKTSISQTQSSEAAEVLVGHQGDDAVDPGGVNGTISTRWPWASLGVSALALILGALWTQFLLQTGLRLSGDSVLFMDLALGAASGAEVEIPPNRAPLYIWAVTGLMAVQGWPTEAAALLAGASLMITILCTGLLTLWLSRSVHLAVISVLLTATWAPFLHVVDVAWTEHLYAALLMGHLVFMARHWVLGRSIDLVLAAVLVAACALTRYLGFSLIGAFGLYCFWLLWRNHDLRHRIVTVISGLLAIFPPGLWLLRNHRNYGTLTGERDPSELTLLHNLGLTGGVLEEVIGSVSGLGILLVGGLVAVVLLRKQDGIDARGRFVVQFTGYICSLVLLYVAMMLWAATRVRLDLISMRYFSPLLPLLPVLVGAGFTAIRRLIPDSEGGRVTQQAVRGFIPALLLLGTVLQLGAFIDDHKKTTDLAKKPAHHNLNGYSHSTTASDLGPIMEKVLDGEDQVVFTLLSHHKSRHSKAFFGRQASLRDSGYQLVGFRDWGDEGYTVDLEKEGRQVSLQFMETRVKLARQLSARWSAMIDGSGAEHVYVLLSSATQKELFANDPIQLFLKKGRLVIEAVQGEPDTDGLAELAEAPPFSLLKVRRALPGEEIVVPEVSNDADKGQTMAKKKARAKKAQQEMEPGYDPNNPFSVQGKNGVGYGWGTHPGSKEHPLFKVEDGVLHVTASIGQKGTKRMTAVGPWVSVSGEMQVFGSWMVDGIETTGKRQRGARLMVKLHGPDNQLVRTDTGEPYWSISESVEDVPWTDLSQVFQLPPEAMRARFIVDVVGSEGVAQFKNLILQDLP